MKAFAAAFLAAGLAGSACAVTGPLDSDVVNDPGLAPVLGPGATGEGVLRAQVLQDRAPLPKADHVVVDKSDSTVSLIDAAGNTIAQYPASTGSEHDPLPLGHCTIRGVSRNPEFHYNPALFWDAGSDQSRATIRPG